MAGYCGECNEHYNNSYQDHEWECPGEEVIKLDMSHPEDRFQHDKNQQGWSDDMDEEIWDKHYRNR